MPCEHMEIGNFFSIDKKCTCGWNKLDEENLLNLSDKILVEDLICPNCCGKTYYQHPLAHCRLTKKLCITYDCEKY